MVTRNSRFILNYSFIVIIFQKIDVEILSFGYQIALIKYFIGTVDSTS